MFDGQRVPPVPRFEVPEGWAVQAFCFALDPTPEQAACAPSVRWSSVRP
jgi:hypothetical protein